MSKTFEHKTLGVKLVIRDLTQGHIERYVDAIHKHEPPNATVDQYRGAVVRSVVEAEWIERYYKWGKDPTDDVEKWMPEPLTVDGVADLRPAVTRWIASRVGDVYKEVTTIPPD